MNQFPMTVLGFCQPGNVPLTQEDIDWDKTFIQEAEADIIKYSTLAANADSPQQRGAYNSHLAKAKKDLARHQANLKYKKDAIGKPWKI